MTTPFTKITRRPEFDRDIKYLLKRFRTLEEDLKTFIDTQLPLFHKHGIDNRGIVHINNLGIENPKIYKAVKFACKSLPGRGAKTGIRLTYAYFEETNYIEFIQIYFKAKDEKEDKERIKSIYKP